MINYQDHHYMLGTSQTTMASLQQLRIPLPDTVTGAKASTFYIRTDMHRVGDGFAYFSWVWDIISREALSVIYSMLGDADSVTVYVRTNIQDSVSPSPSLDFHTYSAIMYRPIMTGDDGTPVARSQYSYQSLKLQFVDAVKVT